MTVILMPDGCVQVVDKAVMILTNDNLELACQVVEKTASDKAIREVDERLQMAYQVRHACDLPQYCCPCAMRAVGTMWHPNVDVHC